MTEKVIEYKVEDKVLVRVLRDTGPNVTRVARIISIVGYRYYVSFEHSVKCCWVNRRDLMGLWKLPDEPKRIKERYESSCQIGAESLERRKSKTEVFGY